jgi:hypothetical protein
MKGNLWVQVHLMGMLGFGMVQVLHLVQGMMGNLQPVAFRDSTGTKVLEDIQNY